jgi:hypothetical protein
MNNKEIEKKIEELKAQIKELEEQKNQAPLFVSPSPKFNTELENAIAWCAIANKEDPYIICISNAVVMCPDYVIENVVDVAIEALESDYMYKIAKKLEEDIYVTMIEGECNTGIYRVLIDRDNKYIIKAVNVLADNTLQVVD